MTALDTLFRAHAEIHQGDFTRAITDADQIIEKIPQSTVGFDTRALAELGAADYTHAGADFKRALAPAARQHRAAELWLAEKWRMLARPLQ